MGHLLMMMMMIKKMSYRPWNFPWDYFFVFCVQGVVMGHLLMMMMMMMMMSYSYPQLLYRDFHWKLFFVFYVQGVVMCHLLMAYKNEEIISIHQIVN